MANRRKTVVSPEDPISLPRAHLRAYLLCKTSKRKVMDGFQKVNHFKKHSWNLICHCKIAKLLCFLYQVEVYNK